MKVTLFNGSPRGFKSNSNTILNWLEEGFNQPAERHILKQIENHQAYIEEAGTSDLLVFAFPLYTDAMPGIVMAFFEALARNKSKLIGKKILFIIHSGFPESCHSLPLKSYLIGMTKKLEMDLIDVVIKGGSEAFRSMPEQALEKHRKRFKTIGKTITNQEPIDQKIIEELAKPVAFNSVMRVGVRIMKSLGLLDMYFRSQLKENNALDRSYDRPYLES